MRTLKEIHADLAADRLTKKEAAAELGLSYEALVMRLKRANLLESVRKPRGKPKFDSFSMENAKIEALSAENTLSNAEIARKHGIPPEQYAAFSMRVLNAKRSRMKRTLRHDTLDSGPARGGLG